MSRRATCLDNAAWAVFDKLKVEIVSLQQYANASELTKAINSWINYYNQKRIQIKLGGQSPLYFERQLTA
ncbi:IS3 family transposase [Furfurilactobacillus entadae]|uniref:IS3 family transposase n=1 Tax=Furfurilactobacillus entadae TaxID=2922307 RepID=UPI0038B34FC5